MWVMEPNLARTPFFLGPEFLLKTASFRSVKHPSITLHSYFLCKSLHWSLQSSIYLPKFQVFYHHWYRFVANTLTVALRFLVARFYTDSFVLKRKTSIHPKKAYFPNRPKFSSCTSYTKEPVVADAGHLAIIFSP